MAIVKRLSKVAKELNVGISTIVDHLQSIGEDVGSNPNTKIGEQLYLILLKEFQREKFEKEKANEIQMERDEMKVISIKREQEEAKEKQHEEENKKAVIKASAEKLSGPSVLGKINIDPPKKEKKQKLPIHHRLLKKKLRLQKRLLKKLKRKLLIKRRLKKNQSLNKR
jgi:translation initiation factor IF-2